MKTTTRSLVDEDATVALGFELASGLNNELVFLSGDLGAGKTTLVRGVLRAMGYTGVVKSPTYTIIEPYQFKNIHLYHMDFYRIKDVEELSYIGIEEIIDESAIHLIEWPQIGESILPPPDIELELTVRGQGRTVSLFDYR